ncbi:MAG: cyclic nucleotide-binding domain-containing protein [Ignavibacteriae bacterium]|nr:cyclic nucleotide-binding domain-containing protein [Ignavibacteriota bacterium]
MNMQDASLINKIRYNVLFESASEEILQKLLPNLNEMQFAAGQVVFEDGSEGDSMYLILSGSVKICKVTKMNEEVVLGILHAGDFFGELEMLDTRPRSARVSVMSDSKIAVLNRKDFNVLLDTCPAFAYNLLRMMSLRLRTSNQSFLLQGEHYSQETLYRLDKMHKLIEASKIVNSSLDLQKLLSNILQTATGTTAADRGTLFIIDEIKKELWSKVLQGESTVEIRLPIGKGIAGFVAATGETINIPDAYADSRFNPEVDKATGYRTKTILCMPMKNKDGKIIGVFQLLNKANATFSKEDEEFIDALSIHASIAIENAQLAQQMVQSERLSAVGQMASTIIHDIKNPMGTLRVYAQVIKKKSIDDETKKMADEMISQVDRFVKMTQEILDFTRGVSSMNIQECEFSEVMDAVLLFIAKDLTKRNVQLVQNTEFKGMVQVDQDKLMRVFYNIAGNAADAMPNGGTLTVNTFEKNKQIAIEFVDTGTGMPEEVKAKIFEPFMTFGKKHGTGLGMAIVKKIIDDHHGKIEIDSEMGKGTTIRIMLPTDAS